MQIMQHTIEINADCQSVFHFCLDVEKWPTYFEPCLKSSILFQDEQEQIIQITALAGEEPLTWKSERKIDKKNHIIRFHQPQPTKFFKQMGGAWRFFKTNFGVLVSLEHEFECKDAYTLEEAQKIIHNNSEKELLAMKTIFEGKHHAA